MGKVRGIAAAAASPDALLFVGNRDQATFAARVTEERVGALHQAFLGKFAHSMTNDAVPFHFSKAQAAVASTSLGRLPRQHHQGTRGAAMDLVG